MAPDALAILHRAARLYGSARTWRATITTTRPRRTQPDVYRVVFGRPRHMRLQVTMDGERILRISDGRHLRLVEMNPVEGGGPVWNKTPIPKEIRGLLMGGGIPGVGSQMGEFLAGRTGLEGNSLRLKLGGARGLWVRQLPRARWHTIECERVQLFLRYAPKRDGEPISARETWWFSPADGRLIGAEYHLLTRGNVPFYERGFLSNQEFNAQLPPDTFVFQLPRGARHE